MLRFVTVFLLALTATSASAQERRASHCFAIADASPEMT